MKEIDINQENPFNVDNSTLEEMQEEAYKRVFQLFVNKEIEIIDEYKHDYEYYKKIDKKYNKRFNKLIRNAIKYWGKPYEYYFEVELLFTEMEFVKYQSSEYINEQRLRLIREINLPFEFKNDVLNSMESMKNKTKKVVKNIKNKFRKA